MAKLTLVFALVLIVLGVAVFVATGSYAPTALIPAYFGVLLGILGVLANSPNSKRRMLFMHIAVTIALIGFIFPGWRGVSDLVAQAHGHTILAAAMKEELAMAAICLVLVLLCIRSFIAARRQRVAAQ